MVVRMIIVSLPDQPVEKILKLAEENGASDITTFAETQKEDRTTIRMLAGSQTRQEIIDAIQSALSSYSEWQLTILPVETTVPIPEEEKEATEAAEAEVRVAGMTREEIAQEAWNNAKLDLTYIVFVVLSTIVAALGMLGNSVAIVVGAMVIAPLLGPNLALAVGVALGDGKLVLHALRAGLAGIALAFVLSLAIGFGWPMTQVPAELLTRTYVGFSALAVALASGAAAAMSLVTGVSSALVGVMVATALLPPISAAGLFLGSGQISGARDAALLLAVNVVSVNLAAFSVLLLYGVGPRTFYEKRKARRGVIISGAIWVGLLLSLVAFLSLRTKVSS
jgi:uncharacterized hydrophobic protein (TIGR00341 family)